MQIRCNVCSTVVAIGDDVARALAKRGGSVPCRNCKTPIVIAQQPNASAAKASTAASATGDAVQAAPTAQKPIAAGAGAAQGAARTNAPHLASGSQGASPNAVAATTRTPGVNVAPSARTASPNAAQPMARTTSPTSAQAAPRVAAARAALGDASAPPHGAKPGVAASRSARHTIPFGPAPAAAPVPAARAPMPSVSGRDTGGARGPGAAGPARAPMPSVSGATQRMPAMSANRSVEAAGAVAQIPARPELPRGEAHSGTAEPAAPPKRIAPPPPRSSITDTPVGTEGIRSDRSSHRPIPPLPRSGPERLRAWVRQQTDPNAKPQPIEQRPAAPPRATTEQRPAAPPRAATEQRPAADQRPGLHSRAFFEPAIADERDDDGDDDQLPTARPPPVAALGKGVWETAKLEGNRADLEPAGAEPEFISVAPDPISVAPDAIGDDAELAEGDDDLPTLPPTGADPAEDDGDDEPTIVEPYSFFATRNLSIDDRPSDRPTNRAIPAATRVPADARPSPPALPAQREAEPRRAAAPPPPPRVGSSPDRGLAPIAYPGAAIPAVRGSGGEAAARSPGPPAGSASISGVATSHQKGPAASMTSRAAPASPPVPATVPPVLSSRVFQAAQGASERSKKTNMAAAIAALLVVAAAGYLGAMSGRRIEASAHDTVPSEPTETAKIETPPPPEGTAAQYHDPRAAPPVVEAPAPPPTREVHQPEPAPPPPPREVIREAPPPRRTTTEEETPRPRESTRPKSRTSRPASDEEGAGNGAPETRLPDPAEPRASIDQGALRAAFAEGEAKAKSCLGATSPTGVARISVTFAPSGEAVGAVVSGSPFANTLEGQCMAAKFRTLHVPPFAGPEVIVRKSISFL